jgi:pimeloyl-ACP methyl ester carboxylesterase
MLEVIDKGQCTDAHDVPVLFVHGGCHAAWCWDEHFLDFFAAQGFRAAALSLRCHGGSAQSKPLQKCTISDYVDDVRSVADTLGREPILIGHSMGGFVVQKYLETFDAPAGVLMASVPPQGVLRSSMRIWLRHPWIAMRANIFGESHEILNTVPLAREHLFSPYTPAEIVESCIARVEPDSLRAVFINQLFGLPDTKRITTPLLVLGGIEDGMISNGQVRATARAYDTEATLFPRMGHNMMVEPGWRAVAEHIGAWLAERNL